ncbi:MAG TPA: 3'(2'),5'-bisphosphate nucleotidase CysQ [Candidatus Saccharimonadales bacterium]|nr:3'(2'),5'-bisphosphate nucleotidase CysQ [Candidatus Saccharimonadales bacterium]
MQNLLTQVIEITRQAGEAILETYGAPEEFEIEDKDDAGYVSPLTKADKASHEVITQELKAISDYPVISEEGSGDYKQEGTFWLVDPLDGTKEFIGRNGEFTVNIGLIKDGEPVLGVVYQPAGNVLYAADEDGAFKITPAGKAGLKPAGKPAEPPRVVVSRNHKGKELEKILAKIGRHTAVDVGSSLKFCLLAEDKAQVYPRFVPTYLWDTAAADAILRRTGGEIRGLDGNLLAYEPDKNIKNPLFIATAKGNGELYERIMRAAERK